MLIDQLTLAIHLVLDCVALELSCLCQAEIGKGGVCFFLAPGHRQLG
jgi:hypothetical protein